MNAVAEPALIEIAKDLAQHGLVLRGTVRLQLFDDPPADMSGKPGHGVLMIGHYGSTHWSSFCNWLRHHPGPDPLDRWTRASVEPIAERHRLRAIYPFDKPYWPFQRWGAAAEGLQVSPLGILMHPEHGLWHAWRAALVLPVETLIQDAETSIHPCASCDEKPCLSACPVSAFSVHGFNVDACRNWLGDLPASSVDSISDPTPNCLSDGCAARNACPVGRKSAYGKKQMQFHMAAFSAAGRS